MTRDPQWQAAMRSRSLEERLAFAAKARAESKAKGSKLDEKISDVNDDAIRAVMQQHDVSTMLHGHTHRPAIHKFTIDRAPATRIVLGDWYEQGSVVRWNNTGFSLNQLPR
jgi:UDP-2,3-diacylglucosamine hydrolase